MQLAEAELCGAAFLSTAAQSLLRVLLEREPAKRLGSGPQGSEAVMAHPFFRPISWARLLRREARHIYPKPEAVLAIQGFSGQCGTCPFCSPMQCEEAILERGSTCVTK